MSQADAFLQAYTQLNDAQRRAVDQIEGPVLVIAGPGTGKTQILTLRIANILRRTDTPPDAILALTFTEAAAQAMRDRLRQYIGAAAYQITIHTFHGFAERVISNYPDAFTRVIGGAAANDIERYEIVQSILDSQPWRVLRPAGKPDYYVAGILQQISACKREYVTPDDVNKWVTSEEQRLAETPERHTSGAHKGKVRSEYTNLVRAIEKHREFAVVYRQYEALLRERSRYDFDDMILETVAALQHNETLRRTLQEQYHYILADEHQDVNESQNQILLLLAEYHERPNIFVVGDEKQAIYRFQGASLSNFLFFSDHFPHTTTIQLTENYRSGQVVLDAAHGVIATDDPDLHALRVPLTAAAVSEATVALRSFPHSVTEEQWVVDEVQATLARGVAPAEVAIIVRTNRAVEEYTHALRAAGVAVNATAEGAINNHPIVLSFRNLLRVVADPTNESALALVLHAPYWEVPTNDLVRLLTAREKGQTLRELLSDSTQLDAIGIQSVDAFTRITTVLELAHTDSEILPPHRLVERVLHESGWLAHIHERDPLEGGRIVRRLYDTVVEAVHRTEVRTVADLVRFLDLHEQYGVTLRAPFIQTDANAVTVTTAHKAKGLEYEVVFVPGLVDSVWGGGRNRAPFAIPLTKTSQPDQRATEDDDRRLLYVAMTRAKQVLYLSAALTTQDGRERIVSRLLAPLEDCDETVVARPDTYTYATSLQPTLTLGAHDPRVAIDTTLLRDTLLRRGLSPTSYNNYKSHPWTYLYRNVLRVPELPTFSLQYGTAMHAVLERAVTEWRHTGALPTADECGRILHHALTNAALSPSEHAQLHEQGLTALTVYLDTLAAQVVAAAQVTTEQHIRCDVDTATTLPTVPVTGALDRIDRDSSGRIIRVVDYKTGTPKTRNAILGHTKSSDGAYYTQLTFYALLLQLRGEHHDDIAYTISFVEPDKKGVVREEVFYISQEEITTLTTDVIAVANEIATGAFLTTPCDESLCAYCSWISLHQGTHGEALE